MANYNINLTPQLINLASEGSLDSSVLNGKSYQRTVNMYEVENMGNRKMIEKVNDGGEFNDTLFQDSTATKVFEVTDLSFDPNKTGSDLVLSNNNKTVTGTLSGSVYNTSLVNRAVKDGQKAIFSVIFDVGSVGEFEAVGIANDSFIIDSNIWLGIDNYSIALWDNGNVYTNSEYEEGYPSFGIYGSIIDVAIDRVNNLIWFRSNGGHWNADPAQDPSTASGGIDISFLTGDVYPGVTIYSDGQFTVNAPANIPTGFSYFS
jgi:hypothetical protein